MPLERMRMTLTREQFLKRCETIYDAGLAAEERLRLLDQWADFVLRYDGVHFGKHPSGQGAMLIEFDQIERRRIDANGGKTLAGDTDGYALIQMAAILSHPCQRCAEDRNAWWTRSAFCPHKVAISGRQG